MHFEIRCLTATSKEQTRDFSTEMSVTGYVHIFAVQRGFTPVYFSTFPPF